MVTNRILFYKMNGLNLIISIVHFMKQNVINSCIYNYLMNLIFLMDDVYCGNRVGLDWNLWEKYGEIWKGVYPLYVCVIINLLH